MNRRQIVLSLIIILLLLMISSYKYATQIYSVNILLGDVDENNNIDKKDAEMILDKIAMRKNNMESYDEMLEYISAADINADEKIDIIDAVAVIRYEKAKSNEELTRHPEWIKRLEQKIEFGIVDEGIIIDLSENETPKYITLCGKNYGNVTYSVANRKIATIDENGLITGHVNGETTIIAKEDKGNLEASVKVIVKTSPNKIELNKMTAILDLDGIKEEKLIATISPNTANINTEITWTSSNTKVATVNNDGTVTGVGNGETIIKATTANGIEAFCKVRVEESPTSVLINKSEVRIDLSERKEEIITATVLPETANVNKKIIWSTSNEEVAMVDNGKIIGIENGTAIITASTENGKEATCRVIVETSPKEIVLNKSNITLDLSGVKKEKLMAYINPETANINTEIKWNSNNTSVVNVENGMVTGISEGEAIITARTTNGKETKCIVHVVNNKQEILPETIRLNATELTLDLSKTKVKTLTATISPEMSNTDTEITWTSSDTNIATVKNGIVTGVNNGNATITAITENGKKAECKIIVETTPAQIILNTTSLTLDLSGTKSASLISTVIPLNSNKNTNVTWTSSDETIARVSDNGTVIGIKNGNAIITAITENGKKAECSVKIQTSPTQIQLSSEKTILKANETGRLNIKIIPDTANVYTNIKVTSSDINIAIVTEKVAEDGKIERTVEKTGIGKVTITATTENGKTANIDILCEGYIDFTSQSMKLYPFVEDFVVSGDTNEIVTGEINSIPQCFDIVQYNKGNYIFFTQHAKNSSIDKVTLTKSRITGTNSRGIAQLERLSCMNLYQFGHGAWLSIETTNDRKWYVCLDVK